MPDIAHRSATFSACQRYRYALWRGWDEEVASTGNYAMFVGLNPSTADATRDDPTVRRCMGFARAWGYGGLCMTNLFAFRATLPGVMKAAPEPVGADNDATLQALAARAGIVIAAWGVHGTHQHRAAAVSALLPRLHCLRLTQAGHPAHPLYLPRSLRPVAWKRRPVAAIVESPRRS